MRVPGIIGRWRIRMALAATVLAVAGVLQFAGVNPAASQTAHLTAFESTRDPGLDPGAAAWKSAPPLQVPVSAQGATYPTGGGSVPAITAQALHYGGQLYVRVEWPQATKDDSTVRVQDFSDAVAVEFPAVTAATVPSICMGQADSGVNIWQWRADSQAGLKDPTDVYSNAQVDFYPSKEPLFYTARAVGNPYADPTLGPIQTLVAQAFGTLTKSSVQDVHGNGVYSDGHWAVVFERNFVGGGRDQAGFKIGGATDMAFAVWNGAQGDRNGKKSVSQFVQLSIVGIETGGKGSGPWGWIAAGGLLVGFACLGVGVGWIGYRQSRISR